MMLLHGFLACPALHDKTKEISYKQDSPQSLLADNKIRLIAGIKAQAHY